jgi:hypothetical protein
MQVEEGDGYSMLLYYDVQFGRRKGASSIRQILHHWCAPLAGVKAAQVTLSLVKLFFWSFPCARIWADTDLEGLDFCYSDFLVGLTS